MQPSLDTILNNVTTCEEVGSIAGHSVKYMTGLTARISSTGKEINDLTIGELLEINEDFADRHLPSLPSHLD